MTEDPGEIKIRYTLKQRKGEVSSSETVHIFPVSRWKISLILVTTFIAVAFLSTFFFSIFSFVSTRWGYSWPLDLVDMPKTA